MSRFTLQPAAGAHGELTGLLLIKAYHDSRADFGRKVVLVPDSAHGTNPASAAGVGMTILEVKSDSRGNVDIEDLKDKIGPEVAAMMLTNPNTLGLFDEHVTEIAEIVHGCGALLYYDGANLNAIMGRTRPGDLGFDVVHLNVHKTFSTPHGGGGPGAGPVGVKPILEPFLPTPLVALDPETGCVGRRQAAVHRQGALVPRQLRSAGQDLRVHPVDGPRRPAQGERACRPERQLHHAQAEALLRCGVR